MKVLCFGAEDPWPQVDRPNTVFEHMRNFLGGKSTFRPGDDGGLGAGVGLARQAVWCFRVQQPTRFLDTGSQPIRERPHGMN